MIGQIAKGKKKPLIIISLTEATATRTKDVKQHLSLVVFLSYTELVLHLNS